MDEGQVTGNQNSEGSAGNGGQSQSTGDELLKSMSVTADDNAQPEEGPGEGKKTEGSSAESSNPAWTAQLPEDLRSNADILKSLSKFQKIGDLSKSYLELEKQLGSSIVKPGKDASAEDVQAFYKKLGKPDAAENYGIEEKDAMPFKEAAFKANLTDEQAKSIWETLKSAGAEQVKQMQNNIKTQAAETEKHLRDEYGAKFDEKLALINRGIVSYGGKDVLNILQKSGTLMSEPIVKMFLKLGEMSAEAGVSTRGGNPKGYVPNDEGGAFHQKFFDKN